MKKFITLPLITGTLISACSSVVDIRNNKFETNYVCDGKDKTAQHYFINRFNREPTEKERNREMLAAMQEFNNQLQMELSNCRTILAKDLPSDLHLVSEFK